MDKVEESAPNPIPQTPPPAPLRRRLTEVLNLRRVRRRRVRDGTGDVSVLTIDTTAPVVIGERLQIGRQDYVGNWISRTGKGWPFEELLRAAVAPLRQVQQFFHPCHPRYPRCTSGSGFLLKPPGIEPRMTRMTRISFVA